MIQIQISISRLLGEIKKDQLELPLWTLISSSKAACRIWQRYCRDQAQLKRYMQAIWNKDSCQKKRKPIQKSKLSRVQNLDHTLHHLRIKLRATRTKKLLYQGDDRLNHSRGRTSHREKSRNNLRLYVRQIIKNTGSPGSHTHQWSISQPQRTPLCCQLLQALKLQLPWNKLLWWNLRRKSGPRRIYQ